MPIPSMPGTPLPLSARPTAPGQPQAPEEAPRRFKLVASLGRPALGDEYAARTEAGDHVAVLMVNGDARHLAAYRDALDAEAVCLRKLRHPGLVAPIVVLELDGRIGVVTEIVGGADLDHVVAALELSGRPFPLRAALEVGAQVADALRAAHTSERDDVVEPVLHRDVKPANVRLGTNGRVRLVQMGIARASVDPAAAAAGLAASEAYQAPERLLGGADEPAGDVFAAALTVAELAVGRALGPTPAIPDNHELWVDQVLDWLRRAAMDQRVAPQAHAPVHDLLKRALSRRPSDRPSAAELANGLDAAVRHLERMEDLAAFARRFLPGLDGILGRLERPIDGLLTERPASLVPAPPRPTGRTASAGPGPLAVLAVGVAIVVLAALCSGVSAYEVAAVLHDSYAP